MYEPFSGGQRHGNCLDASYRAILEREEWERRLEKVYTHALRSLPKKERTWKELDSCMSSDALLMNVFCCPALLNLRATYALDGMMPYSA